MTWSPAGLAARFRGLLHLDDPPRRLACALAVGVFISCTPFVGLQTVLAIVVVSALGLNRAVTVLGMWINLPWFTPFVYAAAIKVGFLVTPGLREADAAPLELLLRDPGAVTWATVWSWIRGSSVPLLIGTSIVGAVAGACTYVVALVTLSRRRRAPVAETTDVPRRHVA